MKKLTEKNKMKSIETSVLFCACYASEHQIIIHKDNIFENGYKEVILEPHLVTHNNIFKRIWVAIKYIFGYKSRYGAWDSIIVTKDNYNVLKDVIEFLEDDTNI